MSDELRDLFNRPVQPREDLSHRLRSVPQPPQTTPTVEGHKVTRGSFQSGAWPRGWRESYGGGRSEMHHTATCSCGWSAQSTERIVVTHLIANHIATISAESSDPATTIPATSERQ